jgi:small basic protein
VKVKGAQKRAVVTVSPEDLSAALDLLKVEEHYSRSHTAELVHEFMEDVAVGVFFLGIILGVATVWVNLAWGIALLGAGVAAMLYLGIAPSSNLSTSTRKLKGAIEDSEVYGAAISLRKRRFVRDNLIMLLVVVPAVPAFGVAFVWYMVSLFRDGEVSVVAFAVMAVLTFVFWGWFALDAYREHRYFSLVASARSRLENRLSDSADDEGGQMEISQRELNVLSRAESHQHERAVEAAAKEAPAVVEQSYGVSIAPEARESLAYLADEDPETWAQVYGTIQSLQFDPRPPEALPAEDERTVEIPTDPATLGYEVDEESHSVYVISVDQKRADKPAKEPGDA